MNSKLDQNNRDRQEVVDSFLKKRGLSFDTLAERKESPFKNAYASKASYDNKINAISGSTRRSIS
jgi:hypothetical protein